MERRRLLSIYPLSSMISEKDLALTRWTNHEIVVLQFKFHHLHLLFLMSSLQRLTFSSHLTLSIFRLKGLTKVLVSKSDSYASQLSEPLAPLIKSLIDSNSYTHVVAGHTSVGRDCFPRLAALIDSSQISDIIGLEGEDTFERPIYAGNAIATVKSSDKVKVFTVRGTAFDACEEEGGSAESEDVKPLDAEGEWKSEMSWDRKEIYTFAFGGREGKRQRLYWRLRWALLIFDWDELDLLEPCSLDLLSILVGYS